MDGFSNEVWAPKRRTYQFRFDRSDIPQNPHFPSTRKTKRKQIGFGAESEDDEDAKRFGVYDEMLSDSDDDESGGFAWLLERILPHLYLKQETY